MFCTEYKSRLLLPICVHVSILGEENPVGKLFSPLLLRVQSSQWCLDGLLGGAPWCYLPWRDAHENTLMPRLIAFAEVFSCVACFPCQCIWRGVLAHKSKISKSLWAASRLKGIDLKLLRHFKTQTMRIYKNTNMWENNKNYFCPSSSCPPSCSYVLGWGPFPIQEPLNRKTLAEAFSGAIE